MDKSSCEDLFPRFPFYFYEWCATLIPFGKITNYTDKNTFQNLINGYLEAYLFSIHFFSQF